jgi:hypothetical protein
MGYITKVKGTKGQMYHTGKNPNKTTSFLPHTIEDKINKAAKNVKKFVKELTD